jgi:signal transduction histidine kinase
MIVMLKEFRTPLHGIMGAASTMTKDMGTDVDRNTVDCLSTILASSRLLLTLINNILDLGKMESVAQAIEKTNVSVLSSIRESISYCEFFASINEVEIVLDTEIPEDLSIICNPLRVQQV